MVLAPALGQKYTANILLSCKVEQRQNAKPYVQKHAAMQAVAQVPRWLPPHYYSVSTDPNIGAPLTVFSLQQSTVLARDDIRIAIIAYSCRR